MSKQFSIIIVPHDNRTTWSFRVSYRLVVIFMVLVGVATVSMAAFVITYGRVAGLAQRSASLNRENDRLRGQLGQVDSLRVELVNLQALGLQLKGMLGRPALRARTACWWPTSRRLPRVHPSSGWKKMGGWVPRSSASCSMQCPPCGR